MKPRSGWTTADSVLVVVLLLLCLLSAAKYGFSLHPTEDAAMLMRYSQHLASGHGIVWNIGDNPVDGATDFLFMVLLAGLAKAGLALELASYLTGLFSHILTVLIVYLAVRWVHFASQWAAFIAAGYLAVGPGMGHAAVEFGTPFFALSVCVTWLLATMLTQGRDSIAAYLLFAGSALIMGLIRPEGVFLAMFMLLALMYMKGLRGSGRLILVFAGTFAIAGGIYFLWRWQYFGYPLPNPYYKKGGGHLYPSSLAIAVRHLIYLSLPFLAIFLTGFRNSRTTRHTIFALIPILGFIGMWIALSNEMNYMMRFQYPILSVVLISWPPILKGILDDWRIPRLASFDRRNKAVILSYAIIAAVFLVNKQQKSCVPGHRPQGLHDIAMILEPYKSKGYTLAVTEAGLIPFYSGWKAIDIWGLNDQWIAHNNGVTESYLDKHKPQVIEFHAFFSPVSPVDPQTYPYKGWYEMISTVRAYAEKRGYILAGCFGKNPQDTFFYYVRPDFPDSGEIVAKIRGMRYGEENFASFTNYAIPAKQ